MKKMAGLKIRATSMLLPGKGKKKRMGRNQKRAALDFPMQAALGDVVDFQATISVFRQSRNAAAAIFFKKVKELAWFTGHSPNHAGCFNSQNLASQGLLKICTLFTGGNTDKASPADSAKLLNLTKTRKANE
jgi:hypothetical protein